MNPPYTLLEYGCDANTVTTTRPEAMAKTKVNTDTISKEEFLEVANVLEGSIGGHRIMMLPREFKTGSFGFSHNGKVMVQVGSKLVQVQINLNLIVVGSKPVIEKKVGN